MSVMPSVEDWLENVPAPGQEQEHQQEQHSQDFGSDAFQAFPNQFPLFGLDMNMLGTPGFSASQFVEPMEMTDTFQDDAALLHLQGIPDVLASQNGDTILPQVQENQIFSNGMQYASQTPIDSDDQSNISSRLVNASGRRRKAKNVVDKTPQPAVPLICHICEGTPKFSDVSHLLTHCSSRAHTKRHFDMKARALTEANAQQTLQTYDDWYEKYEIGRMINKRLREKDEKDQIKKAEAEKRKSTQPPSKKRKGTSRAQNVKKEPKAALSPPPVLLEPALNHLSFNYNNNPSSSFHAPGYPTLPSNIHTHLNNSFMDPDQELEDYDIPGLQSPNGSEFDPMDMEDDYLEDYDEPSKPLLKGKYWPGMDIFDAATEQERRKRNQRKDGSVIRKMKIASQSVETIELVGNLDLEWQRSRDVYDPPSCDEDTPIKRKTPSGRKRTVTPRNSGRSQGSTAVRIKSEPRTPRAGRHSIAAAAQASGRKRATRGSAARAQAQITRMARHEIEGAPDFSQDSEDDPQQLRDVIKNETSSSFGQGNSTRPSTADISSECNGGNGIIDVFQDGNLEPAAMTLPMGPQGHARFPRRSRLPLHPLSRNVRSNANSNLSSPTPSTKSTVPRSCGGKENNSEPKQGMMMAPQPQGMTSQPIPIPNMGIQGMPRSLWDGAMNGVQYPFSLGNGFTDTLLLPPVIMNNQAVNPFHHHHHQQQLQQQHHMGGIFGDDMQNTIFRTHAGVGGQGWHTNNGANLSLNPAAQSLYTPSWLSNNQDATYDEVQNDADTFPDH